MTTETQRTERRELFAANLVETGHLADAAARAGFSPASAAVRANEMLKRADVRKGVVEIIKVHASKPDTSPEDLCRFIKLLIKIVGEPK